MSRPVRREGFSARSERMQDGLNEWIGDEGRTDAKMIATAIDGLRLATLALAEQQRIANLIAVATWNDNALRTGYARRPDSSVDYTAEQAKNDALFLEVRDALGLS